MDIKRQIPLAKPYFNTTEVIEVLKTLDSGWVAQGPRVKKFEQEFAEYCGVNHAVAVNSCTSGLHLSLLVHGIGRGNEVIIPDFTFVATGNVILQTGAIPKIVDVDHETYCMDVAEIEEKITPKTKAIMPVHALGHPADMHDINKLAQEYNITVIEDAASGLGSMIDDKRVGSFGNTACFSLQGRKIITTGEGGMITLDDNVEVSQLRALRSQGSPDFVIRGFSYRLSDIQAGIGSIQLGRIEQFIERRKYLANLYKDLIDDARIDVIVPACADGIRHTYQAYVVLVRDRDNIIKSLREKGIESTIGTHSLSSMPLFMNYDICRTGKWLYKRSLALPMYHGLTHTDVEYIVNCLGDIIRE